MSIGLLIKDESGRIIIDENTFTVRFVATLLIPPGTSGGTRRYSVPRAKEGMFAAGCALSGYQPVFTRDWSEGFYAYAGYGLMTSLPRMPALRVGNGWVEAYPPGGSGTRWTGNVQVTVFTSV